MDFSIPAEKTKNKSTLPAFSSDAVTFEDRWILHLSGTSVTRNKPPPPHSLGALQLRFSTQKTPTKRTQRPYNSRYTGGVSPMRMDLVLMDVVFVGVKRKLKNLVEDLLLLVDRGKKPNVLDIKRFQFSHCWWHKSWTNWQLVHPVIYLQGLVPPMIWRKSPEQAEIIILEGFQPLAVGFQRDGNLSSSKPM